MVRKRDWKEYEKRYKQRNVEFFIYVLGGIRDDVWRGEKREGRGRRRKYSDVAFVIIHFMKYMFNFSNRRIEAFFISLFRMLGIDLEVPDHTTISIRLRELGLPEVIVKRDKYHIIVDNSGVKVCGEGEWKKELYGIEKPVKWTKLHIVMDEDTKSIIHAKITEINVSGSKVVEEVISGIEGRVEEVYGDKEYDARRFYIAIMKNNRDCKVAVPPRKNAIIWKCGEEEFYGCKRNENIGIIREFGEDRWKKIMGYYKRNIAEGCFGVFKSKYRWDKMSSKNRDNQNNEIQIKALLYNILTANIEYKDLLRGILQF